MEKSQTKLVARQQMRKYSTLSVKTRSRTHTFLVTGIGNERNNLQCLKLKIGHHGLIKFQENFLFKKIFPCIWVTWKPPWLAELIWRNNDC